MASLSQLTPYSSGSGYYPSYGSVQHAGNKLPGADDEGGGSFGPVLVVLAVISFLAISACIAGRLGGRASTKSFAEKQQQSSSADGAAEKGLGAVMWPLPSSRATVHHDDEDAFEIKLAPAGSVKDGLSRQYAAGFRCAPPPPAIANNGGVARVLHVRGAGEPCTPAVLPAKQNTCS
ncbi:hypothetical protein BRADI_1g42020v3 [Brachypodium distachyon]|uniref:Uncharacterized protein n=1 Tax=Brachypodium distachyon TaxID=15368 RepID=A0A2K2DNT8_BRADI|nr:hypothetical protein BRADI_1g42020v3 [Brachypodium distachyon]